MSQLWYRLTQLPDLTLNKYASLEEKGVDGVLKKHTAFLRQLNRKGIISGLSFHLFYLYAVPFDAETGEVDEKKDTPGHRLRIHLMVRGSEKAMRSVSALIKASPLADFYTLESKLKKDTVGDGTCSIENILRQADLAIPEFDTCAVLTKTETLLPSKSPNSNDYDTKKDYYMVREWEMNEDGRLYNMCKMMEALNQPAVYRVDLYPVEKSGDLREDLRGTMQVLRDRQERRDRTAAKDYDGKDVLDSYEDLLEEYESSPHFLANIFVFANGRENAISILDAAGSESLKKGKYTIATFYAGKEALFGSTSFLEDDGEEMQEQASGDRYREKTDRGADWTDRYSGRKSERTEWTFGRNEDRSDRDHGHVLGRTEQDYGRESYRSDQGYGREYHQRPAHGFSELRNPQERMIARKDPYNPGLRVFGEAVENYNINYLATMFTLEEIAPFFRLPALYDGEVIELAKETSPPAVSREGSLYLGRDKNGYEVYFPLNLLPKHAFISGVPGSGKTNTMHHITSSLWKDHRIPFLVLEPAKQEYRALLNDPGMKELYLFSPNADMSFPLHLNPFEMPKGILVAEHIRKLDSVFEGAFPLEPPMPFLLDTAIEAVYRDLGWIPEQVYTGEELSDDGKSKRPLPTMSMLYAKLEEEVKSTTYSAEVRGNLESALQVRIGSLMRREMGDVFDVPKSTFTPEKWLETPAVIELESMGEGPANFLTLMLCSLIRETLKVNPGYDGAVRHVIFIEEAHNLIGPESEKQPGAEADAKQSATSFIVKMLAEVRALKESLVIVDQLPTAMADEVLKNTGLKIGLRITSADDRSKLGSTMAASGAQLEQMSTFAVGEALIFYEKLMRPFNMRIQEWWGEIEDPEEKEAMVTSKNDGDLRLALKENAAYRDENDISIDIMLKKYFRMMHKLYKENISALNQLKAVARMQDKKNDTHEKLMRVARGLDILTTEEENQKLYDDYIYFDNYLEENKAELLKATNLVIKSIQTIFNWAKNLERLKNGRWMRYVITDDMRNTVCYLQLRMCLWAGENYQLLEHAEVDVKMLRQIDGDIKGITQLKEQQENNVNCYINKHGKSWEKNLSFMQ